MKRKSPFSSKAIQTLPLLLLIILCAAIPARSQETPAPSTKDSVENSPATVPAADLCLQRLDKTLDALTAARAAGRDKDAQIATGGALLVKEQSYNDELLKAVALLTSSEKRDKNFFGKLREQLGRVLQTATDPKTITTIVSIILIVDRLKR